ncbi:amidase [Rhodovarius lipocyclicus]|uniref:amidase n=1 Tax=Rhodovarius lipocyclicus TaxID=268410 RepID=UPI001356C214|nr:amidase [Rhodovarius lipocyclicus]
MSTAPWTLTLAEASARIADGALKPSTLLRSCLERVAEVEPRLNACIRILEQPALAAAEALDRETPRGPLHGIPVGIKDIIDIAGEITTCHSAQLLDNRKAEDAIVVARLRAAGAVFPAKLSTHEFAIGGPAFDLPFPPARNPWNTGHHPGGSSSGSGASVAAGMFPAALGTDTGGSVRHPASHCGIVGLKPTYDLVPRAGVFPLAFTLDHVGPLTRTVEDSAIMLEAMTGNAYRGEIAGGLSGLRIGYVRNFHEKDQPAHPEMAASLDAAAALLAAHGATVRDIALPSLNDFAVVNRTLLGAESASIHEFWLREAPEKYAGVTRRRLLPGMFVTGADVVQAQRHRAKLLAAVQAAFEEVDILLCASSMDPAARIDDVPEVERTYPRQARTAFNVTGHPAITLMSGLSSGGLPLSVQFVAPAWREALLFRAAAGYEALAGFKGMRPPL